MEFTHLSRFPELSEDSPLPPQKRGKYLECSHWTFSLRINHSFSTVFLDIKNKIIRVNFPCCADDTVFSLKNGCIPVVTVKEIIPYISSHQDLQFSKTFGIIRFATFFPAFVCSKVDHNFLQGKTLNTACSSLDMWFPFVTADYGTASGD